MKSLILPPLSTLYGAVARTRLALYQRGTFRTTKLDRPVISVGNITAGGTGKTPLVEWVAETVANAGKRVCILTRGYGREKPQQQVIVSDGTTILATPAEAGDEPYLLASKLRGSAAVISNADRISAGRYATEAFNTDCFVLDDGFQHLRLARDLNIVTIDATNPWGGGQLLPHGRLREPLSGLIRADCVVVTRCNQVENLETIRSSITDLIRVPLFESSMRAVNAPITTAPVAAFCAVGNPGSFFEQLRKHGYELISEKAFADHHSYTQKDVDELIRAATRAGAKGLVTTAKDAVKLRSLSFSLPWHVFEIEIEIENERALAELIKEALG
ncbi:MAG TPA: tetraacyldisaccharide 4'-kinase [Pyrinomonadaceae bacterium]|nr:tetraacyldisaccharide 4'-kinase [Pyrinomonadaceae bacterium]